MKTLLHIGYRRALSSCSYFIFFNLGVGGPTGEVPSVLRPFPGLFSSIARVIPKQVEDTMDHQKDDHSFSTETELIRLTLGCFHRNDQVSQKMGVKYSELSFPHGEGKDVGRPVTAKVSPVQFSNPGIVDEHDA